MSEQVLVVNRTRVPKNVLENKDITPMSYDQFLCTFKDVFEFKRRNAVEHDANYKQIIPYITIISPHRDHVAVYNRTGSESRLEGQWSIGVGGHINPVDDHLDFQNILSANMERELNEELLQRPKDDKINFYGLYNDDSQPVSSVHLCAIFWIHASNVAAYVPGEELYKFRWVNTNSIVDHHKFESWAQAILRHIPNFAKKE